MSNEERRRHNHGGRQPPVAHNRIGNNRSHTGDNHWPNKNGGRQPPVAQDELSEDNHYRIS
jgi:hypothetical protein